MYAHQQNKYLFVIYYLLFCISIVYIVKKLLDNASVAVHLGVKMADTLSYTAKVDMVDFWV